MPNLDPNDPDINDDLLDEEFNDRIIDRIVKRKGLKEYDAFLYKQAVKTYFDKPVDKNGNIKTDAECMIHVVDFLLHNNIPKADEVAHKLMDDWDKFANEISGEMINEENGKLVFDKETGRYRAR